MGRPVRLFVCLPVRRTGLLCENNWTSVKKSTLIVIQELKFSHIKDEKGNNLLFVILAAHEISTVYVTAMHLSVTRPVS